MLEKLSQLLQPFPFKWPQIFFIDAVSGVKRSAAVLRLLEVEAELGEGPINFVPMQSKNKNNIDVIDVTRIFTVKTPTSAWYSSYSQRMKIQKYFQPGDLIVVILNEQVDLQEFGEEAILFIEEERDNTKEAFLSSNDTKHTHLPIKFAALERELESRIAERARLFFMHQQCHLEAKKSALSTHHRLQRDPQNLTRLLTLYLRQLEEIFKKGQQVGASGIGFALGHELPAALEAIEPGTQFSLSELQILFKNSKGLKEATPFSNNRPFQALVQAELKKYAIVINSLFIRVLEQVKSIVLIGKVDEESGEAFFDVQEETNSGEGSFDVKNDLIASGQAHLINHYVLQVINTNAHQTQAFLNNLLEMESSHICTNDPQFWRDCQRNFLTLQPDDVPFEAISEANTEEEAGKKGSALEEFLELFRPSKPFFRRKVFKPSTVDTAAPSLNPSALKPSAIQSEELQFTLAVLKSYLAIVRRSLIDSVPKAIAHFLIKRSLEELPLKLLPLTLKRNNDTGPIQNEVEDEIHAIQQRINEIDALLIKLINLL